MARRTLRHKFRAVPTEVQGRKYASKLEAAYAKKLHARKERGEILGWFEQVPVQLPGKTKYVLDFLVFEADGTVRPVEVKGFETEQWKIKIRQVRELYPWLPVEVVKG